MDNKTKTRNGIQVDIYGNPVHVLADKVSFRMAKCGHCGETVKLSQTKIHLSYGKRLNICKRCLEELYNRQNSFSASIRDSSKILNTIESYAIGMR